jgi:hypothetical protein
MCSEDNKERQSKSSLNIVFEKDEKISNLEKG